MGLRRKMESFIAVGEGMRAKPERRPKRKPVPRTIHGFADLEFMIALVNHSRAKKIRLLSYLSTTTDNNQTKAEKAVAFIFSSLLKRDLNKFDFTQEQIPTDTVADQQDRFIAPVKAIIKRADEDLIDEIFEAVLNHVTNEDYIFITSEVPTGSTIAPPKGYPYPLFTTIAQAIERVDKSLFDGPESIMLDVYPTMKRDKEFSALLAELSSPDRVRLMALMEMFRPLTPTNFRTLAMPQHLRPRHMSIFVRATGDTYTFMVPSLTAQENSLEEYKTRLRRSYVLAKKKRLADVYNESTRILSAPGDPDLQNNVDFAMVDLANLESMKGTLERWLGGYLSVRYTPGDDSIAYTRTTIDSQPVTSIVATMQDWMTRNIWIENELETSTENNNTVGFGAVPAIWLQDTIVQALVVRAVITHKHLYVTKQATEVPNVFGVKKIAIRGNNIGYVGLSAMTSLNFVMSIMYRLSISILEHTKEFVSYLKNPQVKPLLVSLAKAIGERTADYHEALSQITQKETALFMKAMALTRKVFPREIPIQIALRASVEWVADDRYLNPEMNRQRAYDQDEILARMRSLSPMVTDSKKNLGSILLTTPSAPSSSGDSPSIADDSPWSTSRDPPKILSIDPTRLKHLRETMPFVAQIPKTEDEFESGISDQEPWFAELEAAYFPNDAQSRRYVVAALESFNPILDPTKPIPNFPYDIYPSNAADPIPQVEKGDTATFAEHYKRLNRASFGKLDELPNAANIAPMSVQIHLKKRLGYAKIFFVPDRPNRRNLIEFDPKTFDEKTALTTQPKALTLLQHVINKYWTVQIVEPDSDARSVQLIIEQNTFTSVNASIVSWFKDNIWFYNTIEEIEPRLHPIVMRNTLPPQRVQYYILAAILEYMCTIQTRADLIRMKLSNLSLEAQRQILYSSNDADTHEITRYIDAGSFMIGWCPTMQTNIAARMTHYITVQISPKEREKLFVLVLRLFDIMKPLYEAFLTDMGEGDNLFGGRAFARYTKEHAGEYHRIMAEVAKFLPVDLEVVVNVWSTVQEIKAIDPVTRGDNQVSEDEIRKDLEILNQRLDESEAAHSRRGREEGATMSVSATTAPSKAKKKKKPKRK